MIYKQIEDRIILEKTDDFDIEQILECGQCFRFYKVANKDYIIIVKKKVLRIIQTEDEVIFYPTNTEEFESLRIPYFDLNRDYDIIKRYLTKKDINHANAVKLPGIRILQQEPWSV